MELFLKIIYSEPDACDNEGKTSLFYASEAGHLGLVKLLVSRNANVNARTHEGTTPLRATCLAGRREVCKYLLEMRADANYVDLEGRTTLGCLIHANTNVTF